jgi:hypothetical protein
MHQENTADSSQGTDSTVQKKALKYISDWTQEFENSGESNLGLMSELYDSLRKKSKLSVLC